MSESPRLIGHRPGDDCSSERTSHPRAGRCRGFLDYRTAGGQGSIRAPEPKPPSPRRVLIVDDGPLVAAMLADVVSMLDYEGQVATNGSDALRLVSEFGPDVVLLDIDLPGMTGEIVLARVRDTRPDLPVSCSRATPTRTSRGARWSWARSTTWPNHSTWRGSPRSWKPRQRSGGSEIVTTHHVEMVAVGGIEPPTRGL
jgi:CheY-like chemotaxis protein